MSYTTIVPTGTLAAHLPDADWASVDCRFRIDDPAWGDRVFAEQHIPGAAYAHLGRDLAGAKTGTNGRHPLPSPSDLTATLGRLGIAPGMQVVAYDQDNGMFAGRLWWLLRWMGHDRVAVLDGGFAKWVAEGRPLETGPSHVAPRTFVGAPTPGMIATLGEVEAISASGGQQLVDARAPARYRGDEEPIDRAAGHIPGATNHWFQTNVREDGTLRDSAELAHLWERTLAGRAAEATIVYCGSGVTACQNLLAMEHAGLRGARLYPGSWSEWSSDPKREVKRGEGTRDGGSVEGGGGRAVSGKSDKG